MNKQIKELARQAQVGSAEFDNGINYFVSTEETFNKFAELIIKECALLCVSRPGPGDDVRSREHCSEQILQHFGVER